MLSYHPIAIDILNSIDALSASLNRDLIEISKLQLIHSGSEDFALRAISRFSNKVSGKIMTTYKNCDIIFSIYDVNGGTKITSTQRENPSYRLIIRPIDCYKNFLKGLSMFSSSFVLQRLDDSGYQNVFSLIVFNNGAITNTLYASYENDNKACYLNGRQAKIEERTSFSISSAAFNSAAFLQPKLARVVKEAFSVISTNSIGYDTALISEGKLHALVYDDEQLINILPSFIMMDTMFFTLNLSQEQFAGNLQTLQKKVNFIASGASLYAKVLSLL